MLGSGRLVNFIIDLAQCKIFLLLNCHGIASIVAGRKSRNHGGRLSSPVVIEFPVQDHESARLCQHRKGENHVLAIPNTRKTQVIPAQEAEPVQRKTS